MKKPSWIVRDVMDWLRKERVHLDDHYIIMEVDVDRYTFDIVGESGNTYTLSFDENGGGECLFKICYKIGGTETYPMYIDWKFPDGYKGHPPIAAMRVIAA